MNNSQVKYTSISIEKKCNQLRIREVIRKSVDWCDEIYKYLLSYAYNFCREIKTTNVLFVVKNWMNNKVHVWYGHLSQSPFSSVIFHNVVVIPLYTFD